MSEPPEKKAAPTIADEGDQKDTTLAVNTPQDLSNVDNCQVLFIRPPKDGRGWGFNRWLYRMALALLYQGHTKEAIKSACESSPEVMALAKPGEIERQVEEAWRGRGAAPQRSIRTKVTYDSFMVEAACQKHPDAYNELTQLSPFPDATPQDVVTKMFPDPEAWVCCGKKTVTSAGLPTYAQYTKQRHFWLQEGVLDRMEFLVPNPMKGAEAQVNPSVERMSPRCNANVLKREFIVYESDFLGVNMQAAVLLWLMEVSRRLVVVVHSGGKSLHGFFHVGDMNEEDAGKFFDVLIKAGGDEADRTLCQFARLPGGVRENGAAQSILYFDPSYGC